MRLTTGEILLCLASGAVLTHAQQSTRSHEPVQAALTTGPSASVSIDDYVEGRMNKRHIPGVSVAIVHNGKVVHAKGYGLANVELSVPAN